MLRTTRLRALLGLLTALLLSLAGTASASAAAEPITVANTNDGGPGSLRQTIADAPAGATIAVPAGTYSLTGGEIAIAKSLTIRGAGASTTIVRAGTASRLFHTSGASSTITISEVTIRDGHPQMTAANEVDGGGVLNDDATLTLSDDVITLNSADADGIGANGSGGVANGGGVFNGDRGTLRLVHSSVLANTASADGSPGHAGGAAQGGGAAGNGALTVVASVFSGNQADSLGDRGRQARTSSGRSPKAVVCSRLPITRSASLRARLTTTPSTHRGAPAVAAGSLKAVALSWTPTRSRSRT